MDFTTRMIGESILGGLKESNLALATSLTKGKSSIPGLKKTGKKLTTTHNVAKQAKIVPHEDHSGNTDASENDKVSLHGYLKLPKGQKLTPADLDKAEKKATKEGNEAIIKRINAVRRFVEKKPNKDNATGKRVTRGYAVYRGIKTSPKAPGIKPQKCLVIGFGQLDYYYISGDARRTLESIDRNLTAAFKANANEAAQIVNQLARAKKLLILMRWDVANKRVHVPANAVTAGVSVTSIGREISFSETSADFFQNDDNTISVTLRMQYYASDNGNNYLIMFDGERATEAIASGLISLSNLHRSLFALGIRLGLYTERVESDMDKKCCDTAVCEPTAAPAPVEMTKPASAESLIGRAPGLVAKASLTESVAPRALSPKVMKKVRGTPLVRIIESGDKRLEIMPLDWALILSVMSNKLRVALICQTNWSVSMDQNDLVRFRDNKNHGSPIQVNSELLKYKLA